MKYTILFLAAVLSGCGYHMTPQAYATAAELCAPHGGLVGANNSHGQNYTWVTATCKNNVEATARIKRQD